MRVMAAANRIVGEPRDPYDRATGDGDSFGDRRQVECRSGAGSFDKRMRGVRGRSGYELACTMTDMPPLLEARALVKRLGGRLVVDGVDLDCHAGQVLGCSVPTAPARRPRS